MTRSGEDSEQPPQVRRLRREIDDGFSSLGGAILVIGAIVLPLVYWWTHNLDLVAFSLLIIVAGGGLSTLRLKRAGDEEMHKLLGQDDR